jgi:hypothetical protein
MSNTRKPSPDWVISNVEVAAGKGSATVWIRKNIREETEPPEVILAAYGEGGTLLQAQHEPYRTEATPWAVGHTFTLPQGTVSMKAFLWDSVDGLSPLTQSFTRE